MGEELSDVSREISFTSGSSTEEALTIVDLALSYCRDELIYSGATLELIVASTTIRYLHRRR